MKKYKLLKEEKIGIRGHVLFRIQALKDFGDVKRGERGGFIEKELNLSQKGNAWVYENALVYGNAWVYENALVFGNALVYGNAEVYGNAKIYENVRVYENALVYGNAKIYENAEVYGNVEVYGDAKVYGNAWVSYGILTKEMFLDMQQLIAASLNILPVKGRYILYKKVNKTGKKGVYTSCYDPKFKYRLGKVSRIKDFDPDKNVSCGCGIHASTPFYWTRGDTLIAVEVKLSDVITCLEGKLRVKAVKVLYKIKR